MQDQLAKIRKVKRKHENAWLAMEGVVAIGIGMTQDGEMGILISTSKAVDSIREQIAARVEDVSVEVKYTGEIRAL